VDDRSKSRHFRIVVLSCITAALADCALAGVNLWTTNGPGSPQVTALAADPATPTTVYLGTFDGRIFKSTNGGVSWTTTPFSFGALVNALVFDPFAAGTVYAATDGGLYKSSNGGSSWTVISSGIPFPRIKAIAIDPVQSGTLYVANFYNRLTGEGGIFKSLNGGQTWVPILTGFFGSLVVDPGNPSIVYAGRRTVFQGDTGTVVKSTDGGASWSTLPITGDVYAVVLDPLDPGRLYAGLDGAGVFRTLNAGESWSPSSTGLTNVFVRVMVINPAGELFAGSWGGGVFRSINSASTWTAVNSDVGPLSLYVEALATANAVTVYRGSRIGRTVLKSEDSGESWALLSVRLANANVTALALDPGNPAVIYAGTSQNGDEVVFKSTNGGMSWTSASEGIPSGVAVHAMAVDPFDSLVVYADHYKSTNGGVSWTIQTSPPPSTIFSLVADPTTPNVLYAGAGDTAGGGAGIYKSTDGGEHWTRATSPVPLFERAVREVAIDPATPSTLYAVVSDNRVNSTDGGVLKSIDSGETFEYVLPGQNAFSVAVDPATPSTIYAGVGLGIWKSVNGGLTWSPLDDVHAEVTDIAINPARPPEIFAAAGVVFRSLDGGASWGTFNSGLTYGIQELRIRADGNLLHGASTGGGVYEHEIRALSFYTVVPCRVVDTRVSASPNGGPALGADIFRIFQLSGQCGVPSTAVTVAVNLTVTQATALGHLRIFPEGTLLPEASSINYSAGQTRSNNGLLALSPAGEITVYCKQFSGTTHLILDVVGYFQ
jgi:photosystem II stability/assembly factor-like uncharacterized protein